RSARGTAGRGALRHRVEDPEGLPGGWPGVGAVALVCRERRAAGRPGEGTARYSLTSLRAGAAELAKYIRDHWGIGNGSHWVPDVSFRGTRAGRGPVTRGRTWGRSGGWPCRCWRGRGRRAASRPGA